MRGIIACRPAWDIFMVGVDWAVAVLLCSFPEMFLLFGAIVLLAVALSTRGADSQPLGRRVVLSVDRRS